MTQRRPWLPYNTFGRSGLRLRLATIPSVCEAQVNPLARKGNRRGHRAHTQERNTELAQLEQGTLAVGDLALPS